MVTTIAAFILVISVLVFVHEFGHYLAARWHGVRVITFSVGFGPKLLRLHAHGTEYCLSAIPLGGYVRMATGQPASARPDEYYGKSKWQRIQIMAAGPAMNFLLAVVALVAMAFHGFDAHSQVAGQGVVHVQPTLVQAMVMGVQATVVLTAQIAGMVHGLLSGAIPVGELAGPLGIAQLAGNAARSGWLDLLALTTMLSLNLGLMNLLPIPMLDGGHIALIAIEGVRGRDFTLPVRRRILTAGLALLLTATAATIYNDISRITEAGPAPAPATRTSSAAGAHVVV